MPPGLLFHAAAGHCGDAVKRVGPDRQPSDGLIFDKGGGLIFRKDGKLSQEEIQTMTHAVQGAITDVN